MNPIKSREYFQKNRHLHKEISELLFSVGVFVFFAFMLFQTSKISNPLTLGTDGGWVDARTFPKLFCGLGAVLAMVLSIQNALKLKKKAAERASGAAYAETEEATVGTRETPSFLRPLISILLIAFFIASVKWLGVIAGGWIYLFAQTVVLMSKEKRGLKSYIVAGIVAFLVPLAVYFPFRYIFYIMLPLGIFKF